MSNVSLPASFLPAGTGAQTATAVPGTIADPPRGVLDLANGTLLRGEVIGRDRQGHVLVKTHEGVLPVASKAQLPEGSQVTLQIRSHGAQLHISVLQVDGHSPHLKVNPPTANLAGDGAPKTPAGAPPSSQAPTPNAQAPLPAPPGGGAQVPGTVTHAPPAAAGLPNGAVLQGAVLGNDAQGQLLVRTDVGTLAIATDANAKPGSQISLQVRASAPSLGVVISLPDAAKPAASTQGAPTAAAPTGPQAGPQPGAGSGPATPATGGANAPTAGLGHQGPTTDILNLGQTVTARVESQAAAARLPSASPLPSQTSAAATTATPPPGVAPPAGAAPQPTSGPQPTPGSTSVPTAAPATASPSTAATTTPQSTSALPAPGNTLSVRVVQVVPPADPATASAAFQAKVESGPAGTLRVTGQVIGTTPQGQPLVDTALGRVSLALTSDLPPGTRLLLEVPTSALATSSLAAGRTDVLEPTQLAYRWPGLELALDLLRGVDAPLAEALVSGQGNAPALPSPGPRLTSSMLFFLTALNGGDPAEWLSGLAGGQLARSLEERNRSPLLRQLAGELGQMGRLTESSGDWRMLAIPFADGQQVHPLRLFLRRDQQGSDDPERERETATRFVLEVELTRLGDLQMDGLVRRNRFDLILRSRRPLAPIMQRDIGAIFQAANEAAGVDGQVVFQSSSDWRPMPVGDDTLQLGEVMA